VGETIPVEEGAAVYEKQVEERAERRKRENGMDAEYTKKLREELELSEYDVDDAIVSTKSRFSVNPLIL
jgi:hypothetical protein